MWHAFYAQAAGSAPPAGPDMLTSLLPLIAIMFAVIYFMQIRPQQKRDRERNDMLGNLGKGDEVVTTGGICGTIVSTSDQYIVLRVDDNTKIRFVRQAIAHKAGPAADTKKA